VTGRQLAHQLAVEACRSVEPRFHNDKERSAGKCPVSLNLGMTVNSGDAAVRIGRKGLKEVAHCPLGVSIGRIMQHDGGHAPGRPGLRLPRRKLRRLRDVIQRGR
jgi:hypothetical protein